MCFSIGQKWTVSGDPKDLMNPNLISESFVLLFLFLSLQCLIR